MKRFLLAASLSIAVGAIAAPITPEQALERLSGAESPLKSATATAVSFKYAKSIDNKNALYLYQRGENNGYVVLSADDAITPVLGYCDEGALPAEFNQLPDNMQYWLNSLAEQIDFAVKHPVEKKLINRAAKKTIQPLCTTKWNQSAPFNNKCPQYNGKTCVTGCVATALAQVLKYYNWPYYGVGTHTYTWKEGGNKELTFDYGATQFDWANMIDSYNGSYTTREADAVSTLMYACGVGVDMMYTPNSSGAYSRNLVRVLVENFNYDKGIKYVGRQYYNLSDWEDLVYENLNTYGPVLYDGQSNNGGHQFVCDGYKSGYFHFNWGWGGMSDGWFLLTALDPGQQGIGGSTSGYNFRQNIVTGVQTLHTSDDYAYQVTWEGDFKYEGYTASTRKISFSGSFYNHTPWTMSRLTWACELQPVDGGETYRTATQGINNMNPYSGFSNHTFEYKLPSNLPDGTYIVYPVWSADATNFQKIPVPVNCIQSYKLTLSNGEVTMEADEPAELVAAQLALQSDLYIGSPFKCTAKLNNMSNDKEYSGILTVAIKQNSNWVAMGNDIAVTLQPGARNVDWEYVSPFYTLEDATVNPGACQIYIMEFTGDSYTPILGGQTYTIKEEATPNLSISNFSMPDNQLLEDLTATFTLNCSDGYFAGNVELYICDESYRILATFPSEFIAVKATSAAAPEKAASVGSTNVTIHANWPNGEENTRYGAVVFANNNQLNYPQWFTTGLHTGIKSIGNDEVTAVSTQYFNLAGMPVAKGNLTKGIYIVKETLSDGNVKVRKINNVK